MLPKRALTNFDIIKCIDDLQIPNFRGVYMRDNLPYDDGPKRNECMVINHDSVLNSGTHWTCFAKINRNVYYFDSFGKLSPPIELLTYLGSNNRIFYNYKRYQKFNTINCGHLCLKFLYNFYHCSR